MWEEEVRIYGAPGVLNNFPSYMKYEHDNKFIEILFFIFNQTKEFSIFPTKHTWEKTNKYLIL